MRLLPHIPHLSYHLQQASIYRVPESNGRLIGDFEELKQPFFESKLGCMKKGSLLIHEAQQWTTEIGDVSAITLPLLSKASFPPLWSKAPFSERCFFSGDLSVGALSSFYSLVPSTYHTNVSRPPTDMGSRIKYDTARNSINRLVQHIREHDDVAYVWAGLPMEETLEHKSERFRFAPLNDRSTGPMDGIHYSGLRPLFGSKGNGCQENSRGSMELSLC